MRATGAPAPALDWHNLRIRRDNVLCLYWLRSNDGWFMSRYSELELRYARPIANTILSSRAFRNWLISGTKYEVVATDAVPVGDLQKSLRSPNMENPYWFNYWCGKDANCACRIGTGIETDILLVLDCNDRRRLALHMEIKRPGEKLGNGQAESYPRRAACWANPVTRPRTVVPHDIFLTILACGRDLSTDDRISHFDKTVYHEDIARQIFAYPERAPSAS